MAFPMGVCLWTQQASWPEILQAAELADDLGFESIWTVDHLLAPQGEEDQPILEGWSVLNAIAARTSRARLGLFVAANTFRHPAMTAKLATTLDHISAGRAIVGLGAAWHVREHAAYGVEFGAGPGERIGWLDESAGLVHRLLDGEIVTTTAGRYRVDDLQVLPAPVQAHVPMAIGGAGEKKTLRVVARHADIWNAMGSPEFMARKIGILGEHCDAVGRDISEILLTVGANIIVRDDRDEAQRVYQHQMDVNRTTDKVNVTVPEVRWLGPADELVDRLHGYVDSGVQGLVWEMPYPFDLDSMRAVAEQVRPRLG